MLGDDAVLQLVDRVEPPLPVLLLCVCNGIQGGGDASPTVREKVRLQENQRGKVRVPKEGERAFARAYQNEEKLIPKEK